jgi:hypothetical protein
MRQEDGPLKEPAGLALDAVKATLIMGLERNRRAITRPANIQLIVFPIDPRRVAGLVQKSQERTMWPGYGVTQQRRGRLTG